MIEKQITKNLKVIGEDDIAVQITSKVLRKVKNKKSQATKQQRKCNDVYTFSAVFGFKGTVLFLLCIINIPIKHN